MGDSIKISYATSSIDLNNKLDPLTEYQDFLYCFQQHKKNIIMAYQDIELKNIKETYMVLANIVAGIKPRVELLRGETLHAGCLYCYSTNPRDVKMDIFVGDFLTILKFTRLQTIIHGNLALIKQYSLTSGLQGAKIDIHAAVNNFCLDNNIKFQKRTLC